MSGLVYKAYCRGRTCGAEDCTTCYPGAGAGDDDDDRKWDDDAEEVDWSDEYADRDQALAEAACLEVDMPSE